MEVQLKTATSVLDSVGCGNLEFESTPSLHGLGVFSCPVTT